MLGVPPRDRDSNKKYAEEQGSTWPSKLARRSGNGQARYLLQDGRMDDLVNAAGSW